MLGVYTIVKPAAEHGWGSGRTLALGAGSLALLAAFIVREATARNPLIPLRIFRSRNVTGANLVQVADRRRDVRDVLPRRRSTCSGCSAMTPLQIGLAFLPVTVVMGTLSVRYSEPLITRFGARQAAASRGSC